MVEGIGELFRARRIAEAEAGIVRRNYVIARRQSGDQPVPHPRRRRKTMQQQKGRPQGIAGFLIMNADALNRSPAELAVVSNVAHSASLPRGRATPKKAWHRIVPAAVLPP